MTRWIKHEEPTTVDIEDCVCVAETELAIQVMIAMDDSHLHWIPKSVIEHEFSEVEHRDDEGTLTIYEWWAIKEGLV